MAMPCYRFSWHAVSTTFLGKAHVTAEQARPIEDIAMAGGLPIAAPVSSDSLFTRRGGEIIAMCNALPKSQITRLFVPFHQFTQVL